ncbi:MAG: hypothetical protein JRJ62_13115 [Deltaproteobacteria bacterium]|nr:hypothetical protein [Deltaproteobacteria bacterium]
MSLTPDIPNWAGLIIEISLGLGLFIIERRSAKRDSEIRELQEKVRGEAINQNREHIEYMTQLVEAIKISIDTTQATRFTENMSNFFLRKVREIANKFLTLWEGYERNQHVRLGGKLRSEISILGTNLIDLVARAKDTLQEDQISEIQELAFQYKKFETYLPSLRDRERFEELGQETKELTQNVLEKI